MKTLLLDIGGIFFYPAWRLQGITRVSKKLNVEVKDFKIALNIHKKPFYTGKISETEYWNQVLVTLNTEKVKPTELKKLYRSYVQPISETLDLLPELSSRYTLISCNNSPKEWMNYRIKIASLDKYFSKFFTSGYLGYMKPEYEIYKRILNKYTQNDLLYFDDNSEYIAFAKDKFKMSGKVYTSPEDLRRLIR